MGLVLPAVVAWYGAEVTKNVADINKTIAEGNHALKEQEINAQYIQIAAGVLNEAPGDKAREPMRLWAIEVLKKFTPVPLDIEVEKGLREQRIGTTIRTRATGHQTPPPDKKK